MELAKLLVDLVIAVIWPATILVIFLSIKNQLLYLLESAKKQLSGPKDIRAKIGAFELTLETKQELHEQAELIKSETNPIERLRKAKATSKNETIINGLTEEEVKDMIGYHMEALPDTFLPDWWHMPEDYKERLGGLMKKGLVGTYNIYSDEMCYFTPLGAEVLKALGIAKNNSNDN